MTEAATSSGHTPGPWRVMNRNDICADNEHESRIADLYDENESWRANARLIAAAPELIAVCEAAFEHENECFAEES